MTQSPSGSGKSTLLNCLSDSVPAKSLKIYGDVISQFSGSIFVQQEDVLFTQLSVEETLMTSAKLKSLKSPVGSLNKNKQDVSKSVSNFILDLGLKKSKTTRVGDAKTRGISGGEKKRLSIGNELIGVMNNENEKVLIFCDEPTSGLDSFQAQRVIELLKDMTNKGNTVITSIHQPRSSIYKMFDEITLISEGRVIYTGDAKTMPNYFSSIGYPCPKNVNPAEYYIDLVSIDYSSPEQEELSKQLIIKLAETFLTQYDFKKIKKDIIHSHHLIKQEKTNNQQKQLRIHPIRSLFRNIKNSFVMFKVLYVRAVRQITRDKALNIARFMSNLFSGLLFGTIYYQLSNSAVTVADRLGLLQVAAVNTAMLALIKAITTFSLEKLIVQRERRNGLYSVFPYLLSKVIL